MVYFAVGEYGYEGGIQVTASHNPAQYNGMKIVRRGALPVGGDTGLDDIKRFALADAEFPEPPRQGEISERDVYEGFHDRVLQFIDPQVIRPLKVVLDGANGMAGPMVEPLLASCHRAVACHMEPDGSFPDHEPNPLLEENRQFILSRVLSEGADLGIAWDGDADRCFFIDDTATFVDGDLITALMAEAMLEKYPGGDIVYDLRASWAVPDTVRRGRRHGAREPGRPRLHQGPHPQGGRGVRRRGLGPLLLPRLLLLRHRHRARAGAAGADLPEGQAAVGAARPVPRALPHLRRDQLDRGRRAAQAPGAEGALPDTRAARLAHGRISFEFEDWHFNVRPSNTEPLLRLNLEALDGPTNGARRDEVLALIRG